MKGARGDVIVVVTAVNDESGKIDEKKSCGACVFFERNIRFPLEDQASKEGFRLIVWNQQQLGSKFTNPRVPKIVQETSGSWYPKVLFFQEKDYEKIEKDTQAIVAYQVYNGKKNNDKWELESKPMRVDKIIEWAKDLQTPGSTSSSQKPTKPSNANPVSIKKQLPSDPLDEVIVFGRKKWKGGF
jgi:hypothetical protein